MVAPVELVRLVLTEDWSDDYAASEHWSKYWNAASAPSDDKWAEGLTEDGDKLFLKDKLLVPENRVEELIDHWHIDHWPRQDAAGPGVAFQVSSGVLRHPG